MTVADIPVPDGEMTYTEALAWLVSLGQTEFGAAGTLLTALKQPRALIGPYPGTAQITCGAKPARIFRAVRLDQWSMPLEYEVAWGDGSLYVNSFGQTRLSETEAKTTAPRIGGTWRRVTGQKA